jgi:hypothetical protein
MVVKFCSYHAAIPQEGQDINRIEHETLTFAGGGRRRLPLQRAGPEGGEEEHDGAGLHLCVVWCCLRGE